MSERNRLALSLVGLALFGGAGVSLADPPLPTVTTAGVWTKHEYSFAFMGFTSTYSCDGLADKLKILLVASGARPDDIKARPGACAYGYGRPDKLARADLVFYTLTPAQGAATADDPPVPGTWRSVVLARRSPRELALGDCELVEQFKTSVLPMFATRNVMSHTTCVPHQDSGSVIDLKFDAFSAVPKAPPPKP